MVLTVDLLLFTLLSLTCYCYTVKLQFSILSRVLTILPVRATVLVYNIVLVRFFVKGSGRCLFLMCSL
jgi:hypothetical protein